MASSSETPASPSITRGEGFSIKQRFKRPSASTRPMLPRAHAAAVATSPLRSASNSISVATIAPPARTQAHAAARTDGSACRRSGSATSGSKLTPSRDAAMTAAARFGPCTNSFDDHLDDGSRSFRPTDSAKGLQRRDLLGNAPVGAEAGEPIAEGGEHLSPHPQAPAVPLRRRALGHRQASNRVVRRSTPRPTGFPEHVGAATAEIVARGSAGDPRITRVESNPSRIEICPDWMLNSIHFSWDQPQIHEYPSRDNGRSCIPFWTRLHVSHRRDQDKRRHAWRSIATTRLSFQPNVESFRRGGRIRVKIDATTPERTYPSPFAH